MYCAIEAKEDGEDLGGSAEPMAVDENNGQEDDVQNDAVPGPMAVDEDGPGGGACLEQVDMDIDGMGSDEEEKQDVIQTDGGPEQRSVATT